VAGSPGENVEQGKREAGDQTEPVGVIRRCRQASLRLPEHGRGAEQRQGDDAGASAAEALAEQQAR